MHNNNITAEVLYSTRTLVVNVSKLLPLKVFHFRPAARMPFVATLFASIRAIHPIHAAKQRQSLPSNPRFHD